MFVPSELSYWELRMVFKIDWIDTCTDRKDRLLIATPLACLQATICGDVLCALQWLAEPIAGLKEDKAHPVYQQIMHYWHSPNQPVTIKLLKQGTQYRQMIGSALITIPVGSTISYKQLAAQIGSSPRAVAGACRHNPYPLIIPCHRVVSVSGPGGYCGQTSGRLYDIKQKLLDFERQTLCNPSK